MKDFSDTLTQGLADSTGVHMIHTGEQVSVAPHIQSSVVVCRLYYKMHEATSHIFDVSKSIVFCLLPITLYTFSLILNTIIAFLVTLIHV